MKYLETEHEKKSFVISTCIMALILLLCIFFGMTYMDPPPDNGVAINFGNVDEGMGKNNSLEPTKSAPQPTESVAETQPVVEEEIITQDEIETVAIKETPKVEKPKKPVITEEVKPKPVVEEKKPSKSTSDALSSLMNGTKSDGTTSESDGNGNKPGNQGKIDGSIYSNSYFGKGSGTGTGNGSYGLAGRALSKREYVVQKCNEEGKVVVEIRVNRNGEVIQAIRSQGTTNSAKCLEEAAIATAKTFKWKPDSNAPEIQIGFIEINFRLGE
jgi:TonB family protein